MTPAELFATPPADIEAAGERMVSEAMDESGFDPVAIAERCRDRHAIEAAKRGLHPDDFEGGAKLAAELFQAELTERVDQFIAGYERRMLGALDGLSRTHRRRAAAELRKGLQAGRNKLRIFYAARLKASVRDAITDFDAMEGDFTRLMLEAMED